MLHRRKSCLLLTAVMTLLYLSVAVILIADTNSELNNTITSKSYSETQWGNSLCNMQLGISIPREPMVLTKPMNVHLSIRNTGDKPARIYATRPEMEYDVVLTDSGLNRVPYTSYGKRMLKSRNSLTFLAGVDVKPGETVTAQYPLDTMFAISSPGKYTLRISRVVAGYAEDKNGMIPCTLESSDVQLEVIAPDEAPSAHAEVSSVVSWGSTYQGHMIGVRTDKAYGLGMPIVIEPIIVNTSDREITVGESSAEEDYEVIVKDGNGNIVPLTDYGKRMIENRGIKLRLVAIKLAPGEQTSDKYGLSRMFRLDKPGEYAVQVSRAVYNALTREWGKVEVTTKITVNDSPPPSNEDKKE